MCCLGEINTHCYYIVPYSRSMISPKHPPIVRTVANLPLSRIVPNELEMALDYFVAQRSELGGQDEGMMEFQRKCPALRIETLGILLKNNIEKDHKIYKIDRYTYYSQYNRWCQCDISWWVGYIITRYIGKTHARRLVLGSIAAWARGSWGLKMSISPVSLNTDDEIVCFNSGFFDTISHRRELTQPPQCSTNL